MSATDRAKLKPAIELFYTQNNTKTKKYDTYLQFKDYKVNGRPVYSKPGLYKLMATIDERGSANRKTGSGRPQSLSPTDKAKLKRMVNHKTGVSQNKLSAKFKVAQKTISNHLKYMGIEHRKRKRAPKQTPSSYTS